LRGVDPYIHIFLAFALVGGELSASLLGHFTTRESAPDTYRATKDEWAPESVWITWEARRILPLLGLDYPAILTALFQGVAKRHYICDTQEQ
jgi:hypothetical protein